VENARPKIDEFENPYLKKNEKSISKATNKIKNSNRV